MAFKRVPQKFNASINKVVVGTGDKTITLGGENVLDGLRFVVRGNGGGGARFGSARGAACRGARSAARGEDERC